MENKNKNLTLQGQLEEEFKQLKPEDREKFERLFFSESKIIELRDKQRRQERNFQMMQALETSRKITEIEIQVLKEYKKKMEVEIESVNLLNLQIPYEQRQVIINDIVAIHMVCDVLESLTNEISYLLDQYAPDWKIESFDEILNINKKATEQIQWVARNTDLMDMNGWYNESDNFVKMFRDKAAKLMRKSAENRARRKEKEDGEG